LVYNFNVKRRPLEGAFFIFSRIYGYGMVNPADKAVDVIKNGGWKRREPKNHPPFKTERGFDDHTAFQIIFNIETLWLRQPHSGRKKVMLLFRSFSPSPVSGRFSASASGTDFPAPSS
jgi:hypothetical protein